MIVYTQDKLTGEVNDYRYDDVPGEQRFNAYVDRAGALIVFAANDYQPQFHADHHDLDITLGNVQRIFAPGFWTEVDMRR